MIEYTKALTRNIKSTYTYHHSKKVEGYQGSEKNYDSIAFFNKLLTIKNPFYVFMKLNRYAFDKSLRDMQKYGIPYTKKQYKQAKLESEIVEKMTKGKADYAYVYLSSEEIEGTNLKKIGNKITTNSILEQYKHLDTILHKQQTTNDFRNLDNNFLDRKQQKAVNTCLTYKNSVLIGGAGTGKSKTTVSIIKELEKNNKKVVVLAPTHKAKEALKSKMDEDKDVQAQISTVHSFGFRQKQECDAIVIDEAGVLSADTFNLLMRKVGNEQLVFVGDKNQLPPIGVGRPFEIIQKHCATTELTKNYRSDSKDIVKYGQSILGKKINENMQFPNIKLVKTIQEAFKSGAEIGLSHTRSMVDEINESQRIKTGQQSILKVYPWEKGSLIKTSVGDVIVSTENLDDTFNGEIFEVISYDKAISKTSNEIIKLYNKDQHFKLAYGLTIYKSQGSEWDNILWVPSKNEQKDLAYVAVTRAKKTLFILADELPRQFVDLRREYQFLYESNSV